MDCCRFVGQVTDSESEGVSLVLMKTLTVEKTAAFSCVSASEPGHNDAQRLKKAEVQPEEGVSELLLPTPSQNFRDFLRDISVLTNARLDTLSRKKKAGHKNKPAINSKKMTSPKKPNAATPHSRTDIKRVSGATVQVETTLRQKQMQGKSWADEEEKVKQVLTEKFGPS